jgi:biopolymer transport protein ExbD
MRLSSRKVKKESKFELQMTSMIDMVFLLLIFFMTTSSFRKTERELDSAIKVKGRSARAATANLEPAIIEVVRGGSGEFVYKMGTREIETADELTEVLSQFRNKLDGAYVRVTDEAPFDMAATAIQACKTANFLGVSYVPLTTSP